MSKVFEFREYLKRVYGLYSKYIDKGFQFVFGLAVFMILNDEIGFVELAARPLVALVLAVVCTFLPMSAIAVAAGLMMVVQMMGVSIGIAMVVAAILVVMTAFYLRFSPKTSLVILLVPIAFILKIPYAVPIVCGLVGSPAYIVPILCGTLIYYMMNYIAAGITVVKGADGMLGQVTVFMEKVFQDRGMWIVAAAFTLCILLVYTVRKQAFDHAWETAIVSGAIINIIVIVVGDIAFDVTTSYFPMVTGSIVSVLLALIIQLFVFSVDYSRSEYLQFEDDEYCYYVKAVPKISVPVSRKTVKKINVRQDDETGEVEIVRDEKGEK